MGCGDKLNAIMSVRIRRPELPNSGTDAVEAVPVPDQKPRDLAPKQMTTQANIADSVLFFQSPASGRPQMTDLARHEYPSSRQAN